MPWAIEWHQKGQEPKLLGVNHMGLPELPDHAQGLTIMLFRSRASAEKAIKRQYSYIKQRKDLRGPPHNWRMPRAVKVELTTSQEKGSKRP